MHLLATTSGVVDGAAEAIDLKQTPGEVIILTAADSELACLALACDRLGPDAPSLRLANLMQLQHNFSVDLYADKIIAKSRLVIVRILGGMSYWAYGLSVVEEAARQNGIKLAVIPGGAEGDSTLSRHSTMPQHHVERIRQYFAEGGIENACHLLQFCSHLIDQCKEPPLAIALPKAGVHTTTPGAQAGIIFYRALVEAGQTAAIDAVVAALNEREINCTAVYVSSLKDPPSVAVIKQAFTNAPPLVLINATGFAIGDAKLDPLAQYDCPVLQVALAGNAKEQWEESTAGLRTTDLAMNVVLPELDGRIFTRAISFKADDLFHSATQCRIVSPRPVADRVAFVADLAQGFIKLRVKRSADKKIAIVLANYPEKDGRIANGVGYDTPASTVEMLTAFQNARYDTGSIPPDGNCLIEALQRERRNPSTAGLSLEIYNELFHQLPKSTTDEMVLKWGKPENDPTVVNGRFPLAISLYGNIAICIQPPRGYGIDPKSSYHDAALIPPHAYLAVYFWLRHVLKADALIHNGKHGNLEWLPGKSVGLSATCWPEVALGPLPQFYPFIVNDPGEGSQAKRRTAAVIIDHLVPPLTRAETYGPLKDLEALVDEYYLASGLDQRRLAALRDRIFELTRATRLDVDAGLSGGDDSDLQKLDSYLCDLKEAQIRDGLHVFGQSPQGQQEIDLLVALARSPRGLGEGGDASLIKALSAHFGFEGFDPLVCDFAAPWSGSKPEVLQKVCADPWRTHGDTVERLETFAGLLLASPIDPDATRDLQMVLAQIQTKIRPALAASGPAEMAALLAGLSGKRVAPGPSGAPTRGRVDVLPTGRNFYSLDNRTLPTPTAWMLGEKSASELLKRHFQDFGQHLQSTGLSAWGTANMRTGGDDIAQALALIGAKPVWDPSSWRVTGFDILPLAVLGRPRVDVTLRISGFFRDAFPLQIELLDKAIRAVGALDEEAQDNPIASRMRQESLMLERSGVSAGTAEILAGHRIFGSKPGSYGAGLQALIDENIWDDRSDLAKAYVVWGAYAYGAKASGQQDETLFARRLASLETVIHNQDNREHDLLDSDDYYQFEGGMAAAVELHSGKAPRVYHNDHSRVERPIIRTLEEEVGRVMRSRVVNPKWILGVKRHGYKGAFEIAATVDYMFAFAATTGAVKSHHFDLAHEAFILDDETRTFIDNNNPAALKEIAERLTDAIARGLWQPRLNSAYDDLKVLQNE